MVQPLLGASGKVRCSDAAAAAWFKRKVTSPCRDHANISADTLDQKTSGVGMKSPAHAGPFLAASRRPRALRRSENGGLITTACSRHNSHGVFGAIREDNIDLVHYFLQELRPRSWVDLFRHENALRRYGSDFCRGSGALGDTARPPQGRRNCCSRAQRHNHCVRFGRPRNDTRQGGHL